MFSGHEILGKTEEGRREVVSRQRKLAAKARVLLIAIDGHATLANLRQHFASLGDVDGMLRGLIAEGLVQADGKSGGGVAQRAAANDPLDATQRFMLAQKFMNETAVEALGLRAFLFTLKLERCSSVDDLRDLLPEYDRVVGKARDASLLQAYHERLRAWLG